MKAIPHIETYKTDTDRAILLGKGPSIHAVEPHHIDGRLVVSVNGAALALNFAHDRGIVFCNDVEGWLEASALRGWVLAMASWPHWKCEPNTYSICDLAWIDHRLGALQSRGRLYSYDICSAIQPLYPDRDRIDSRTTTAVSALEWLGRAGVRDVTTAGIDGGGERADGFHRVRPHPANYDDQAHELHAIAENHRMRVRAIDGGCADV